MLASDGDEEDFFIVFYDIKKKKKGMPPPKVRRAGLGVPSYHFRWQVVERLQ